MIKHLKKKAGVVDNISSNVIKAISYYIVSPLTKIFNKIFEPDNYPNHFKTAEIIPIYKSGDKKMVTNYCPIALISNFAKIIEKLIRNRLINFLNKFEILSSFQLGFRPNFGSTDALAYVTDLLYENLDKSRQLSVYFGI